MRIDIHAIGRMKAGPERELAERYLDRLGKAGPALGLEFGGVHELAESRARSAAERMREEAKLLQGAITPGSATIVLDERGAQLGSEDFAAKLAGFRDEGRRALALVVGGPDGHDGEMRGRADLLLSLGRMTWPHQIARVLLAEQLYRAATILAGHPYHRS